MDAKLQRGFNLLELMITVFVLAIVLGLGVPSLRNFMDENRMTGAANDLLTGLHLARSEAVKRQQIVTLCSSADPLASPPDCAAGNLDGWVVFQDTDGNGVLDAAELPVIRAQVGPSSDVTFTTDGSYISYAASGFRLDTLPTPAASRVLLCDRRGMGHDPSRTAARLIRIDPTGRPQVLRDGAEIAALGMACP